MAVLVKDLRAELRAREALVSMGVFALLSVVVFGMAFEPWFEEPVGSVAERFGLIVTPGLVWIAFVFSGILGLEHSFAMEREAGALDALRLAPVDRGAIYLGKAAANACLIVVIEAVVLPVFALFFNVPMAHAVWRLIPVGLLGALGFSAAGTIFAAVAANTRMRNVMLPLLLFPVTAPLMVAAVEATGAALNPAAGGAYSLTLQFLAGFAIIYLTAAYLLFGQVLEE